MSGGSRSVGSQSLPGFLVLGGHRSTIYRRFGKRSLDLVFGFFLAVLSIPVVLVVALALRRESGLPIFTRSIRLGRNGKPFVFYKFRSVSPEVLAEGGEEDLGSAPVYPHDPRVTPLGGWLRRTSLDELPQVWNVLRGEMSLVGPRPPYPEEAAHYARWQEQRFQVKPGLTCLWQVSGRSKLPTDEWVRLDIQYARNLSFLLDLKLLLRTIPAVLSREGAY
jgi:lipopolysaccharide/colanic/teichoic acid biosynthesis glycosyltransferase